MDDSYSNDFLAPKQSRAKKTLQDIVESAEALIQSGDTDSVTTEKLSAHSGYSVGGIFHYFKKREDIFVYVFMLRRQKKCAELAEMIRTHSPQADIASFITAIVNASVGEFGKYRLKILQFMLRTYYKRAENPLNFDTLSNTVVNDWINAIHLDQTNTFADMDQDELIINMRALIIAIRTPFFENSPIAGTEKHKMLAIKLGVKLFGK